MKAKLTKVLALVLLVVMVATCALIGCKKNPDTGNTSTTSATDSTITSTTNSTGSSADTSANTPAKNDKLVVAYNNFNEKFSPFFATSAYDVDVYSMTQVGLLATDRGGNIVYNGIEGETTPYNGTNYTYYGMGDLKVTQNEDGTVDYAIKVRKGVKFSDGVELTIKDVIFSIYAYSDTDYDGSTTFYTLPIEGMNEWRTNLSTAVYKKYAAISDAVLATFDDATGSYVYAESAAYTRADFDSLVNAINTQGWVELAKDIDGYVASKYASEYSSFANNGIAAAMGLWGFGAMNKDGTFTDAAGVTYDMTTTFPTIDDYANALKVSYKNDFYKAAGVEKANADYDAYVAAIVEPWIAEAGKADMAGQTINSISGITYDENAYTINVKTTEFSATTVYQLGVAIAPLHYYGELTKWDPANGSYGFTRGNLDKLREKTTKPLGAGPYKFVSYQSGIVTFEANELYWEGAPKIKNIMFKEYADKDKLPAVIAGEADIANPSISDAVITQIKEANGVDTLAVSADLKISTDLVDNNGYGYFGINSENVKVGADKGSAESKNLRKALATLAAVYREYTVNSYYHERASVIEYPITNCSWAAPQPADAGYEIAFSKDVEGKAIYTANMTDEQKYAAAKQAAIGFLKAAGYTWDEATGKFTAAPDGAKMSFEAIIGGDGTGDHPTFALLVKMKEDLQSIGLDLEITDDSDNLFDRMEAGTVDIFVAAWGGSNDPDMYQIYHSSNATNSNHYRIADETLDQLIMDARKSADKTYRKAIYKQCLDIILDWAVEIPVYQRKNGYVYNSTTVNVNTITPDTTPYWSFLSEIYKLEMN